MHLQNRKFIYGALIEALVSFPVPMVRNYLDDFEMLFEEIRVQLCTVPVHTRVYLNLVH